MITLAIAGKPNCGKSTFFKAATVANVEIANYPFTTINPNFGVAYVRTKCPCHDLHLTCGHCVDGNRFVAVNLIDVAGLVPDAHKGKGLGNQFLDNLRQADAILHIVDASGGTDSEGNPVGVGNHDPEEDIKFLIFEMTMWVHGIPEKHWTRISRMSQGKGTAIQQGIADIFTGLGITAEDVRDVELKLKIDLVHATIEDLIPTESWKNQTRNYRAWNHAGAGTACQWLHPAGSDPSRTHQHQRPLRRQLAWQTRHRLPVGRPEALS